MSMVFSASGFSSYGLFRIYFWGRSMLGRQVAGTVNMRCRRLGR